MDSPTEKLELGLRRLAKAGDDADLLGLALQSIHGALEDHFRARLAADMQVPEGQRTAMLDPRQVQWKELLDAMQLYGNLSAQDRELIWRTNGLRSKVAHGGRYSGTRADLERYAALVQSLCGYRPPARPAGRTQQPRPPAEKPAAARATTRQQAAAHPAAAPDIPRAVRSGAPSIPARARSRWPGGLIALALLIGLALVVVLRSVAQPLPAPAAAATDAATAAPTAAPAPTTSVLPTPPHSATVAAPDGLNLRSDHSSAAAVLAVLPNGTRVIVLGGPVEADNHTWWNVEIGAQRGWCAGEFLTFEKT